MILLRNIGLPIFIKRSFLYNAKTMSESVKSNRTDDLLLAGSSENVKRFTKLIANSFAGITLLNKDLEVLCRSASAEKITGWSDFERAKHTHLELAHPDDKSQVYDSLIQLLDEPGASRSIQYRSLHFDGHYIWLDAIFTNHIDDEDIGAIVMNFQDITNFKVAEEKLEDRGQFIQDITDHLPVMISYWDTNLCCRFANKPYSDWFGFKSEQIVGLYQKDLFNGREYAECAKPIAAVLRGEPQLFERTFVKPGGQIEYIQTKYWPDKDRDIIKGFYSTIELVTDIRNAQATIESNHRALEDALVVQQAILNALPPSVCVLDEDGWIVEVNKSWREFGASNGLSSAFYGVGYNYLEISKNATGVEAETSYRVADAISDIIAGKLDFFATEYPCDSQNEKRWFKVFASPLNSEAKKGAVIVHVDISDRKAAEDRLAESEQQYRRIVETAQEGVWMLDDQLRATFVNEKMCEILEYTREEIIGKHNYDFQVTPKLDRIIERMELRKKRIDEPHETVYVTKSGRLVTCLVSPTGIFDKDGNFGGMLAMVTDITERKIAEVKLADSEAQYRRIVEIAQEGIWLMDAELRTTFVNQKVCEMLEYSKDEIVGHFNYEFKDGSEARKTFDRLESRKNGVNGTHETVFITKTGRRINCKVSPIGIFDENGVFKGTLGMVTDITELKKVEEELKRSRANILAVIENTDDIVFSLDRELNLIVFNTQFSLNAKRRYHSEVFEGQNIFEVAGHYSDEEKSNWKAIFDKTFKGEVQQFTEATEREGQIGYLNHSINPIYESGIIIGVSCITRDVTQQVTDELALIKSETNLRKVFDATELGIVLYDADFNILSFNNNAAVYFKRIGKKELEIGGHGLDYFQAERVESVMKFVADAKQDKQVIYDILLIDANQANLWLEVIWEAIWNDHSEYVGVVVTFKDITERKNTELRLQKLSDDLLKRNEDLKLMESVVTKSTDAIMIMDPGGDGEMKPVIGYVNKAFTKLFGYEASEVIGKSPVFLCGPNTDGYEMKKLFAALSENNSFETTISKYKKNGEECFVNLSVFSLINEEQNSTYWIALIRDVTNRRFRELQRKLLAELSDVFNEQNTLLESLNDVLSKIGNYANFCMAEIWLVDRDEQHITRNVRLAVTDGAKAFEARVDLQKSLAKGEGLVSRTWETGEVSFWNFRDDNLDYLRLKAARKAGFRRAYAVPFYYNKKVIGSLTLFLDKDELPGLGLTNILDEFSVKMGAEIRRKQLEDELNQIFDLSPDIIFIGGTDGYLKRVNPAACKIMEYSAESMLSTPMLEMVHPDDREETQLAIADLFNDPDSGYFENRCLTASGNIKWVAWTATTIFDGKDIFAVGKDITDKKHLESLLTKASKLTRLGGWELFIDSNKINWSEVTHEIHEVPAGYIPNLNEALSFYKDERSRQIIEEKMHIAATKGIPADIEVQIVTALGNSRWVRVIIEAEFKNEKCVRLYGSIQDIDARKKAEQAAHQSLEDKNAILESIDDAFFALDKNWIITYWNSVAEKISGNKKEDVVGHNIWEIYPELRGTAFELGYQEAFDTQKAIRMEAYYPKANYWNELSIYPSETGLSVFVKMINERKNAELQLKELNASLAERTRALEISNAELEQFAYVASHDLQEPLRMVTSFMTQLERKYGEILDDKAKQYIYFAVDGAKRMREIILDLLEFSRVTRMDEDIELVNINSILDAVITLYHRQIEDLHAKIELDDLPELLSFRTPLRQVFQNLLSNSLKYNMRGRRLDIKISSREISPGTFEISVRDNGIGINKEYYEKIFNIFQRLHNKDAYSGTGMGLAIVKKIIENLGGKIWIESEEGVGTTFFFTLVNQLK